MPDTNDPKLRSFIPVDAGSDFPIQNLPYGVFSTAALPTPRIGVAIGGYVLDLWELEQDCRLNVGELGVFSAATLNPFMALGPKAWTTTRGRISELLRHDNDELRDNEPLRARALVPMSQAKLQMRSPSPVSPISIRRRSTLPMSASCSAARKMRCSRTGCICR
jgi:fumarylacetoacetase